MVLLTDATAIHVPNGVLLQKLAAVKGATPPAQTDMTFVSLERLERCSSIRERAMDWRRYLSPGHKVQPPSKQKTRLLVRQPSWADAVAKSALTVTVAHVCQSRSHIICLYLSKSACLSRSTKCSVRVHPKQAVGSCQRIQEASAQTNLHLNHTICSLAAVKCTQWPVLRVNKIACQRRQNKGSRPYNTKRSSSTLQISPDTTWQSAVSYHGQLV